jgi:hypothetical protein
MAAFVSCLMVFVPLSGQEIKLPRRSDSVKFAVIGDNGTGASAEYELAHVMTGVHSAFPFDFVIMLGDNLYGSEGAAGFRSKFEEPYRALLGAGVKFYASLGNHDSPNERFYKPFNMNGNRYYSFHKGNVQFLALDSTDMDPGQISWLKGQLRDSTAVWKICYFHHPLYSHGRDHEPDVRLRQTLEPIFIENGVQVVFSGHEHDYERLKPQRGISYFVLGNSGQLRLHNLKPSPQTAKAFDSDRSFGLIEVFGNTLDFQIISRHGDTVDFGTLRPAIGGPG